MTETQFELAMTKRRGTLTHVTQLFSLFLPTYIFTSIYVLVLVFETNSINNVTNQELPDPDGPRSLQSHILRGKTLFGKIITKFSLAQLDSHVCMQE